MGLYDFGMGELVYLFPEKKPGNVAHEIPEPPAFLTMKGEVITPPSLAERTFICFSFAVYMTVAFIGAWNEKLQSILKD